MRIHRTYYEVLGVHSSATSDEIRDKYLALVRKYHPDICRDKALAGVLFVQINIAYRHLRDPDRRAEYDSSVVAKSKKDAAHGAADADAPGAPGPAKRKLDDPEGALKAADAAYLAGDLRSALETCADILSQWPDNHASHQLMGDILVDQGKWADALGAYRAAAEWGAGTRLLREKIDRTARLAEMAKKNEHSAQENYPHAHHVPEPPSKHKHNPAGRLWGGRK